MKIGPNSNPLKARARIEALQRDFEFLKKDLAALTAAQAEYLDTCAPLLAKNQELLAELMQLAAMESTPSANTAHTNALIDSIRAAQAKAT